MNPYTSMWTGVTTGDGPQEVHVLLLDNERVGGHAYGSVYPGPIGAVLNPQPRGTAQGATELDAVDAVITGAAVGIATTGTVVLDHGPDQGAVRCPWCLTFTCA